MSGATGGGGGAGAVVRQGHLRKLKTMKKKFFVLRAETTDFSAKLEYYESEKKFKAGAAPRRVLPLKSCYNITRRLDLKQKHVIALFTREEQFCIVAENEQELHAWLTAILRQHRSDDGSDELLHPIQHVWQVNVQKKGLGSSKNIQGLYNLCLTDKTLSLVKIKSHNNVISDLGIPERVDYSLKNIRRCGDSECFFYMEVGRQTVTGAGELWMHTDDSNIAQSMHSTIYHAMRNCTKETENERDHIQMPSGDGPPARRQTYSDGSNRICFSNEKGLCVGSCIIQCVCASATLSIESTAPFAPLAPLASPAAPHAENQPPNNTLTEKPAENVRVIKHHRTVSLPTGCPLFKEPLKICHERTRSAPLTGDEVDRVIVEKAVTHSSCKAINGNDYAKKTQWSRRASTGTRLSKLSPAHSKNAATLRSRCDSMPSRACSSFEVERPPPRHNDLEGLEISRDETDTVAEWYRTPRIPEEPDCCDISKDFMSTSIRGSSIHHSRSSSLGVEEGGFLGDVGSMGLSGETGGVPDGYLPMAPAGGLDALGGLISASSGSVCSGTPSTDPRFSEYQLEPATSHIGMESRPPRAYSVGSRPAPRAPSSAPGPGADMRHRAYSVGARHRPKTQGSLGLGPLGVNHHGLMPRASAEDLMELDFSSNSPAAKMIVAQTPPSLSFADRPKTNVDEYVDMSPKNGGYVEMRPGEPLTPAPSTSAATAATTPDGYVEMNYGRAATRPIAITSTRPAKGIGLASPPDERKRRTREPKTPLGSQTLFPLSLDSPASPPEPDAEELEEDVPHHALSTVREISEELGRLVCEPSTSSSPQYVTLARVGTRPIVAPVKTTELKDELSCNPTATKTIVRTGDAVESRAETITTATLVLAGGGAPARFSLGEEKRSPPPVAATSSPSPCASPSPCGAATPLNYAALDLEPRRAATTSTPRTYTQIDFIRSEKLHAADGT